ncbi:8447_t:CDS:1, partial [Rhizophagus irregularis]
WKDRHPIILQTITLEYELDKLELQVLKDQLQMYKVEGIIKNYDFDDNTEGIGRLYHNSEFNNMCRLRINW